MHLVQQAGAIAANLRSTAGECRLDQRALAVRLLQAANAIHVLGEVLKEAEHSLQAVRSQSKQLALAELAHLVIERLYREHL